MRALHADHGWLRSGLAVMLIALSLAGCGGGGGGSSYQTPPAPSALSYPTPQILVVGHAMATVNATVTGSVSSYSVNPALPAGLSLSSTTGALSGTPTAITAAANYTITASNASGMTTTTISIAVTDIAPAIAYSSGLVAFTAGVAAQTVAPSATGGAVIAWSISPALPTGLVFSTTDGSISGTPSGASPATNYTITAQNSGGSSTFLLQVVVETAPLLDLGHADSIQSLHEDNAHILSEDVAGHWALWNTATTAEIAAGDTTCTVTTCVVYPSTPISFVDMAGPTFVIEIPGGFELRSSSDGHVLSTVTSSVSWWRLAVDGSYLCGGSSSGLSIWSPAGQLITSRPGDYSKAIAYAAAGEVRVADGPAGQNVVETVSVPGGTDSVSPAFQGQFDAWFKDGQRFLTNVSGTVWVYSKAAVQQDLTSLPSIQYLGGQGNWFWSTSANGAMLNVYAVGSSATPTASYSLPVGAGVNTIVPSGTTLAVLSIGPGQLQVIDLSGATPVKSDAVLPVANPTAYAAVSATQWIAGNQWGVVLDDTNVNAARYFGYGRAWSIAGGVGRIAVATASGAILYYDSTSLQLQGNIPFSSSKVVLSADGTVLAAEGDQNDAQYHTDWSVKLFSLPAQTVLQSWSYDASVGPPLPADISLAGSGTVFGQVVDNGQLNSLTRQVIAVPGGAPIWSDTVANFAPLRLSPDGTLIGAADSGSDSLSVGTKIVKNGSLVTAVSGWPVGWIDNNRVLVNNYAVMNHTGVIYSSCSIYDATGARQSCPTLPEVMEFQPVSADSIYVPASNSILSLTTGLPIWLSADPARGAGAVAGAHIVFASGPRVLAQSH